MRTRIRKRSNWASGKGKVPWYSTGFWVAMTRNGSGRAWVLPSMLTWPSLIASSRADWVFGVERLISSARRTWLKMGPGLKSKLPPLGSNTDRPRMSEGRRSLVNWMRRKLTPKERASATPSKVLPIPGTSSMRRWPRAIKVIAVSLTASVLPTNTLATASISGLTDGADAFEVDMAP